MVILTSLPSEIRIFRKHAVAPSNVAYVLARITSAGYVCTTFAFSVAPVDDCQKLVQAAGWCGALALPLNCLLFFFRVRAVFSNSRSITVVFGLLWLAVFGCAMATPFGLHASHIGTTKTCIEDSVKTYVSAGLVAAGVNDTIVFMAISARLITQSFTSSWTSRFRSFLSGQGLGQVSTILLQTGQLYYLATVSLNIVALVCILVPSVPAPYRAMVTAPDIALQNAMACLVLRLLKLGVINDGPYTISSDTYSSSGSYSLRFYRKSHNVNHDIVHTQQDGEDIVASSPSGFCGAAAKYGYGKS